MGLGSQGAIPSRSCERKRSCENDFAEHGGARQRLPLRYFFGQLPFRVLDTVQFHRMEPAADAERLLERLDLLVGWRNEVHVPLLRRTETKS
mgnify:CR=1 FL=1